MRYFILLLIIYIQSMHVKGQSSVVYKRNLTTGLLEVFESRGGLPMGQPLFKIKKNVYGYLEIENSGASENPFTKKPDYSAYGNFKPYQLPAKEIFETLETLNKRNEYDQLLSNPDFKNNPNTSQILKNAETFMQDRSRIATGLLNFYNGNVDFPKRLKDGWYDVTKITKFTPNEAESSAGFKAGNEYTLGICQILNNKISEYYENINVFDLKDGFVFKKINLEVISSVSHAQSTYRAKGENGYSTLYFLDNILDSTKQISNPKFSFYTINTANDFLSNNLILSIQVARNRFITRDEILNLKAGPYILTVYKPNPSTGDCANSILTLAFRESTDKFSIGVLRFQDKKTWIINEIFFMPNNCISTSLKEK